MRVESLDDNREQGSKLLTLIDTTLRNLCACLITRVVELLSIILVLENYFSMVSLSIYLFERSLWPLYPGLLVVLITRCYFTIM